MRYSYYVIRHSTCVFCETDRETRDVNQEDYRRLPDCLTDSLNALEEDTLFNDMMGENLVVCLKAIRKVRFKSCFLQYMKVYMFAEFLFLLNS